MRRLNVAAVVFVALLVVMAVPANVQAASGTLVVGSQHTDFGTGEEANPQTLDNLGISGSGDTAKVELGAVSESSSTASMPPYPDVNSYSSKRGVAVVPNTDLVQLNVTLASSTTATHVYLVRDSDGAIIDSTSYDGANTTLSGSMDAGSRYRVVSDATGSSYDVDTNFDFTSNVSATHFKITGGFGSGTFFDDSAYAFESITGFESVEKDSAKYVSATHNTSNAEEATVNITQASNVSVEATVRTDGGTVLNQTTLTSTGNHTLALADTSSSQLETVLDVTVTGDNAQFELADESILFNNSAPTVDNASASPTGEISQQSITLSINASDETFGSVQGEELTATFYVDGSQVGTDTMTSNGTASVQYEATTGGSKSWSVTVRDSYGASVTSDTFSFQAPSQITFRKETQPSQLVDNATVQVVAYYSGEIQRRNVTNGQLNLTGFPIDEPIIIRANASGYYTRTAVVESVYDQNNVYLLNSTRASYLIRFDLQDLTGSFPESNTVLFVERDIKLNNSTEWRVIAGDEFGVQGVPVNLEQDERYRLRIKNLDTGRTALIGAFTPVQSESVEISTGGSTLPIPDSEKNYGWAIEKNESAQQITFRYSDDEDLTEWLKLTVHERFNESNVLVDNVTFTDANDVTYTQPLTANQTNTTWMGELYLDRGSGTMHFRLPLSGGITNIVPDNLDAVWLNGVGVFVVLISSLAFSELNQGVGAIATALIGGLLWWFGVLSGVATGPTIVIALVVSVVYHYYSNPSPGGGI